MYTGFRQERRSGVRSINPEVGTTPSTRSQTFLHLFFDVPRRWSSLAWDPSSVDSKSFEPKRPCFRGEEDGKGIYILFAKSSEKLSLNTRKIDLVIRLCPVFPRVLLGLNKPNTPVLLRLRLSSIQDTGPDTPTSAPGSVGEVSGVSPFSGHLKREREKESNFYLRSIDSEVKSFQ